MEAEEASAPEQMPDGDQKADKKKKKKKKKKPSKVRQHANMLGDGAACRRRGALESQQTVLLPALTFQHAMSRAQAAEPEGQKGQLSAAEKADWEARLVQQMVRTSGASTT